MICFVNTYMVFTCVTYSGLTERETLKNAIVLIN